jgi:predicted nucleic acid-binding Zn ribbon protein
MPIYEYKRPDGTTFEIQQSFDDAPLTVDPETGVPLTRVFHAPALHFKGKGFYNTDYGTRKRQRELAAAADGSSGDSKGSSGDSAAGSSSGDSSSGDSSSGGSSSGDSSGGGDSAASSSGSQAAKKTEPGGKDSAKSKTAKPVAAKR